jgi:hypothetical protein
MFQVPVRFLLAMFFSILYISPKGAEVLFSFHHFPSNSADFLFDLLFEMLFLSGPGDLRTLFVETKSKFSACQINADNSHSVLSESAWQPACACAATKPTANASVRYSTSLVS